MITKVSNVRGRVPRVSRITSMLPKHRAFHSYLVSLGYEQDEIIYKPTNMRIMLKNDTYAVCRVYTPTFYVVPELALYDVDSNLSPDHEDKIAAICRRDGYEFHVVTEADFPFDEYVDSKDRA